MLKHLMITVALVQTSVHAVILQDGTTADRKVVDHTYTTLRYLSRSQKENPLRNPISVLYEAVNHHQNSIPRAMDSIAITFSMLSTDASTTTRIKKMKDARNKFINSMQRYNICDQDGIIFEDVARVISNSISAFKKGVIIVSTSLHSPVHWKNYLSWNYIKGQ